MELKDLEKFLKICRKQGVTEITFGEISVKFGDLPTKVGQLVEEEETATEELTPDQLIFYATQSAGQG